jgi:hypothetical protein
MVGDRFVEFDDWRENALQHSPYALGHCHPKESTIQADCTRAIHAKCGAGGLFRTSM